MLQDGRTQPWPIDAAIEVVRLTLPVSLDLLCPHCDAALRVTAMKSWSPGGRVVPLNASCPACHLRLAALIRAYAVDGASVRCDPRSEGPVRLARRA
jgi:hypothetical protein